MKHCRCCPACCHCPADTYGITYEPNGDIGGLSDICLSAGDLYTIKTPEQVNVSRTNQLFQAWNTAPDGSGTTYVPGETISIREFICLYAQWIDI
ncbi:InlB B-repeat-containing protein [Eubacteriales bacterium OttesenSCG-928-N13]|nr:InlB B-repeat-containing protein [Eubacteriales bacterium OttesenSCG-928-N13]